MFHNFNAGPAILPVEVKERLAELVRGSTKSLSIIELSHRSKEFEEVIEEAKALFKELNGLSDDFEVLFLQGGASLGFVIAALNFMKEGQSALYINTGHWSQKAYEEALRIGTAVSYPLPEKVDRYTLPTIPSHIIKGKYSYVHFTSNNTIEGTMWQNLPDGWEAPIIIDMSSDIMGRPFDYSGIALVYAGAQKNLGPAGTTIYVVNKKMLPSTNRKIPRILSLETHIKEKSLYHTPCVFAIYGVWLTLKWIKEKGGIKAIYKQNLKKASMLYEVLDASPVFYPFVRESQHRSIMNVTFGIKKPELAQKFEDMCREAKITGIKGHRSVGGYRASLYNALPIESVSVLIEIIREIERTGG